MFFVTAPRWAPGNHNVMGKKDKEVKTNAARLLDKARVAYTTVPYEVDPDNLAATHVAEQLGEDIRQVFKTLVLCGEPAGPKGQGAGAAKGVHFVCVVPGDAEVDLKKAARAAGMKSAAMLPMKELLPLTGYIRGGCSPIGMKKQFPTVFHHSVLDQETIFVSAGKIGFQVELSPADLIELVGGSTEDVTV